MARASAANLPNFSISIVKLLMNPSVLSKTYCAASVQVRGPGRFSDFALCGRKREPHASINGHEHQDSPALLAGGVDYHGAVGRNSRRLVQSAISEDLDRKSTRLNSSH